LGTGQESLHNVLTLGRAVHYVIHMTTETMTRHQAHTFLASLRVGDPVTITQDGREIAVTVQRELRRTDGGGFGSWDHAAVTVGFGPGRWNVEVTAVALEQGRAALSR
jgi:hypothetical protein